MMKCFYRFQDKSKRNKSQSDPTTSPAPTSAISNSGNGTEASYSSTSAKHMTKSAVSVSSARSITDIYEERGGNLRVFDLKELRDATNNFSRLLKIGEGGFGSVYKGRLGATDGKGERAVVAIKMLNQNSFQGHKQWLAEVQFLAVVDHPNLVKLIGYCAVDGERGIQRLLVYEYMLNKSLEDHLFNKTHLPLPWEKRLEIALGAAQGLDYLHEGLEMPVIYRDLKASNVLLDKELQPKLSDFGLAREGPSGDRTHVTTAVVGTRGYAAPDYIETGHLTTKSDVWTFGVVLFEILTGRRSLERNRPKGEQKLLDWVKQFPVEGKKFHMIIDPRLGNQYSLAAARIIAKLANRCLLKSAKERPTMHEVIEDLKEALHVTRTGESTDKREHSSSESESENKPDEGQIGVAESFKRRMVHLARMGDTNNVINRRRFNAMQRQNQAQEAH